MLKLFSLLLGALVLSACVGSQEAAKVAFGDNPPNALLLIKVSEVPTDYYLEFAPFRENTGTIDQNRAPHFFRGRQTEVPQFLAMVVPPGTYAFLEFSQQLYWSICFQDATRSFTVEAGDAVFLGNFEARIHLAQVEQIAKARGETNTRGQFFNYFDRIIPPQITRPSESSSDFTEAKAFEARSMPSLRGRLKPVVYRQTQFRTGGASDGSRSCGYRVMTQPDNGPAVVDE